MSSVKSRGRGQKVEGKKSRVKCRLLNVEGNMLGVKCRILHVEGKKITKNTILLRISLICAFRIFFSLPNGVRRSTFDAGLVTKFGAFQVFINTSVIQDKTLTI